MNKRVKTYINKHKAGEDYANGTRVDLEIAKTECLFFI